MGAKVEPRVTFANDIEPYVFDDQILWKDLEPFYYAMTRIEESIESDEQSERFIEIVEANAHTMMNAVFGTLEREGFGLRLANKCTKSLKNF